MNDEAFKYQDARLVSVVVITYNSSKTIVETLDSIKAQTYENIELIVSDDNSQDDTLVIVKKWLSENNDRFIRSEIVKAEKNTGIAGNNNRGVSATRGLWVKLIAGDDCLLPTAISTNMAYVSSHPDVKYVISKCQGMGDLRAAKNCIWFDSDKFFLKLCHFERRILLCSFSFIPASAAFVNRESFYRLGGYDESIQLVDDWPFWLKVFHSDEKVGYFSEYTVKYRFSESSLSQPGEQHSERYLEDYRKSILLANQYMKSHGILAKWYVWANSLKKNGFLGRLMAFAFLCCNPFFWYIKFLNYKVR